ncbi:MAG: transcription-repair coupling factor [Acidobacteriota bacterium]|nr:MAG: transcription-repair coupling factor [Acidobacteriota bacterium]
MTRGTETSLGRIVDGLALESVIESHASARISGLMGPARSLLVAAIARKTSGPMVVVVADERRLAPAVSDLESLLRALSVPRRVLSFPSFALDPYRGLSPHLDVTSARLEALVSLLDGEDVVIVATAGALLYRTAVPELLKRGIREIRTGDSFDPGELERYLVDAGYRNEDPVTTPGDFTRRGGILDVFPPGHSGPLRLELFGDELEEIRSFGPETQRTTGSLSVARIVPASEWPASEAHLEALALEDIGGAPGLGFRLPRHPDFQASLFDYLGAGRVLVEEPVDVTRSAEAEWERVLASFAEAEGELSSLARYAEPSELLMDLGALTDIFESRALTLQEMSVLGEETRHVSTSILPSFRGRVSEFLHEVRLHIDRGALVRVFVSGEGMADRSVELLSEAGLTAGRARDDATGEGHVVLELGHLSQSFVVPELSLAVFTASDVFTEPPVQRVRGARKGAKLRRFLSDFRDLAIGDYVVHTEHGIGVFTGLRQLAEGDTKEFVVLEYSGGDKLYVPVGRLDYLEKYSSAESAKPKLDKLGGTSWERVKTRVRKSMRDMAKELLKLYAARKEAEGYAFASDTAWMGEFEALFEFEETPDQLQAIADVKRDMETPSPMDRLLCGDVGYGKTEVAMRAAFKAVSDGRQVALLVPTTILAFQHLRTFRERFAAFPVRVEMLSRFKTRKEQKKIVEDLADGKVDIVIGTHRLLSKDVRFHELGLLIVDEEQRFGVSHKERLKTLSHGVDSLTMTATPIPRTLHMSLSGIRDMSVIETPPKNRMAIQTNIVRLDATILTEAIRYELGRGGQVYFVHNRVSSIYSLANYLHRLVPEARIIVGHGQMKESELESVMLRFIRGEFDVLVSTTIIENGLDIPLVNTLMVNRADRFGLSQLYQLRGRVGRSNRRAYAYLLIPDESHLPPIARRRLAAIREFSELGAGFRIAALDLELRGAGNLLGGEQHGHIDAVGFDLYCRLLDETVRELSGEEAVASSARANLNLRIELRLPEEFIPDVNQRMSIYKRTSSARERDTLEELQAETRDRFGPLPERVLQFFEYARLQVMADGLRLTSVDRDTGGLSFRLTPATGIALDPQKLVQLAKALPASVRPEGEDVVVRIELPGTTPSEILTAVGEVLLKLSHYSKMTV